MHTFTMTLEQAKLIHAMTADRMAALKNWTATAVEQGDLAYAQTLVADLRKHEAIFAGFNMKSKEDLATSTGKPMPQAHILR